MAVSAYAAKDRAHEPKVGCSMLFRVPRTSGTCIGCRERENGNEQTTKGGT